MNSLVAIQLCIRIEAEKKIVPRVTVDQRTVVMDTFRLFGDSIHTVLHWYYCFFFKILLYFHRKRWVKNQKLPLKLFKQPNQKKQFLPLIACAGWLANWWELSVIIFLTPLFSIKVHQNIKKFRHILFKKFKDWHNSVCIRNPIF